MMKTIFLQKDTKLEENITSSINVILSPTYYWVKEFELPITSVKEVQKVVPNLFEEYFDISGYKFYVQKIQNTKYLCFAYDEELILDSLKNANIDNKKVSNIYFAQNELQSFFTNELTSPINIDEKYFIYQDNILINIPTSLASNIEKRVVTLDKIEFSKFKISINKSSKYISTSSSYILSTIFILFSILVFIKSYDISNASLAYESKIQSLKKEYKLPSSMIQTKSILKQYSKVQTKYNKTRDAFAYFINFKSNCTGTLKSCKLNNGLVTIVYLKANKLCIKKYISKKYKIQNIKEKNNTLIIEVKI